MNDTLIHTRPLLDSLMTESDKSNEWRMVFAINNRLLTYPESITPYILRNALLSPHFTGQWGGGFKTHPYSMAILEESPKGKGLILDSEGFAFWKSTGPITPDHNSRILIFEKKYVPEDMNFHNPICDPIHCVMEYYNGEYVGTWALESGKGDMSMEISRKLEPTLQSLFTRFYLDGLRRMK